ncbi:MAG: hypothetical protein RL662_2197 [Bacteroidota bacterium]
MNNKLKILQINKYPSIKGGSEVVLFDTIHLLKQAGHQVILFTTNEGNTVYMPTYTTPYVQKTSSLAQKLGYLSAFFYNRKAAQALENCIQHEQPDVAHIHLYLNGLSLSILSVLKKYKIPVVMTLHDYRQICPSYLLLDRHGAICERCIGHNYLHCMATRCSKGSLIQSMLLTAEMYYRRIFYKTEDYVDQFICVSHFMHHKHTQFNERIANKSVVLYNPIQANSILSKQRGDYLLFLGRLSPEKGIDTLLEAMTNLPQYSLKVAGRGDMTFSEIPRNVEFVGFKTRDQLQELIRHAAYVVVPSEWYETFGLSCAEGLSLGTPVIASAIGGLTEIIESGKNGFLFTPKDVLGLQNVISKAMQLSDERYTQMTDEAQSSVEKFSEVGYIDQLMEIYNRLISNV